ncbi:MAG: phenylacetate--CoA ligase family protein [Candidatus Hodarchaeales archaeon]
MIDKFIRFGTEFYDIYRSGGFSYGELAKLNKIQYFDKSKHNAIIDYNLKKIISHAYINTHFYRKLYSSEKIKNITVNNLQTLPIITKSVLRNNFPSSIVSTRDLKRARYDRTSGSTGEPFEFYNDIKSAPIRQSSYMLFNTWMNIGPYERHVQIASPKPPTRYSILRNNIFKKHKISTLEIKRRSVAQVIERINKINPVYIEGYSASLYNTAQFIEDMVLDLRVRPNAIIATSEDLIEIHREKIEDVFDSTVYNRYGSREFSGAVAQECNVFEGSHVNTTLCYVEIVDDEGAPVGEGERGRIIVTDFNNMVMPFIRYDIGDSAVKGSDIGECGRTFPLIRDIKGKSDFFLVSKNDERTPIETIQSYLFQKYAPYVNKFQFLHKNKGNLIVKIIPAKNFNEDIIDGMNHYLESTLDDFTINIKIVDEIPPQKTGKTPYFVVGFRM